MTIALLSAGATLSLASIALSGRSRQIALLLSSYCFYASFATVFLLALATSTLANFFLGRWIRRRPVLSRLLTAVAINVVALASFKTQVWSWVGSYDFVMPLGMSFWTFQALSHLFDVYREDDTTPTFVEFALYLSLWPTVVSGPISRVTDLVPQFRGAAAVSWSCAGAGFRRIAQGLFMKLVAAQLLVTLLTRGSTNAAGFDDVAADWGGFDVWVLAVGFGVQLFLDFAGYSHMAIGAALLLGLRVPENFSSPFAAESPAVFWTRWHMSLSGWIRDYVFTPVALMHRSLTWRYAALVGSMVLFGLWHGTTLPFLIWGAYHGGLLVTHRIWQRVHGQPAPAGAFHLRRVVRVISTFLLVSFGWIFFRAQDLHHAWALLGAIANPSSYANRALPAGYYLAVGLLAPALIGWHIVSEQRQNWTEQIERRLSLASAPRVVRFGWRHQAWFHVPLLAILALVAGLAALAESKPIAPFTYTMF
jgi:alginate O-acetyltransferase complex protein AlgI